jgi:hypothetical protein
MVKWLGEKTELSTIERGSTTLESIFSYHRQVA